MLYVYEYVGGFWDGECHESRDGTRYPRYKASIPEPTQQLVGIYKFEENRVSQFVARRIYRHDRNFPAGRCAQFLLDNLEWIEDGN